MYERREEGLIWYNRLHGGWHRLGGKYIKGAKGPSRRPVKTELQQARFFELKFAIKGGKRLMDTRDSQMNCEDLVIG